MMLEECRFTGRDPKDSLPVVMGMLKFYDSFYQQKCRQRTGKPLDAKGKLVIYPGNSCEMGVGCTNHADAIAGLLALADGLLALPGTDRAWLESFRKRIPEIPTVQNSGRRVIALAESWQSIANPNEFPQLYTVFPFHRYGIGPARPGTGAGHLAQRQRNPEGSALLEIRQHRRRRSGLGEGGSGVLPEEVPLSVRQGRRHGTLRQLRAVYGPFPGLLGHLPLRRLPRHGPRRLRDDRPAGDALADAGRQAASPARPGRATGGATSNSTRRGGRSWKAKSLPGSLSTCRFHRHRGGRMSSCPGKLNDRFVIPHG